MNKEAERLSGQLAAFKSDIKHEVFQQLQRPVLHHT